MTSDRWQRIEELYHSAREREANQRAAFLKEACAGDDALRREVESLLAQEKGLGGFLEAPALEAAAKLLVEGRGQSWVGRQLGSYQVISFLDAGGMGEVYQAHDTRLGRFLHWCGPFRLCRRRSGQRLLDLDSGVADGLQSLLRVFRQAAVQEFVNWRGRGRRHRAPVRLPLEDPGNGV